MYLSHYFGRINVINFIKIDIKLIPYLISNEHSLLHIFSSHCLYNPS